ncbi:putative endo-beta-1,4-glucanase D [Paramyrothecium foliicola]|nr:putative endo-beta-1,4-glucanase D [Paramyrothecium foliicola]
MFSTTARGAKQSMNGFGQSVARPAAKAVWESTSVLLSTSAQHLVLQASSPDNIILYCEAAAVYRGRDIGAICSVFIWPTRAAKPETTRVALDLAAFELKRATSRSIGGLKRLGPTEACSLSVQSTNNHFLSSFDIHGSTMHFYTPTAAAIALLSQTAFAHYNFESLIVNGEFTEPYQYVRKTTNGNGPILMVNSTDIICNAGGIDDDIMAATETFTVAAGDQVGFKMNEMIGHPGPLSVYLSKAPTTAQAYKGDGDWFKVYESTFINRTVDPMQWASFVDGGVRNFTFTLPQDLPPGEYLMRGEHIALHSASLYEAQFYMGCAQIKVTGSGAGTPGPTIKLPGGYDPTDPGILVNMYWPPLRHYTPPGPRAWPNACDDSTVNVLNGQESDGDCTPLEDSAKGDAPIDGPAETPAPSSVPPAASSTPEPAPSAPVASSGSVSAVASSTLVESAASTPVATPSEAPAVPSGAPGTPVPTVITPTTTSAAQPPVGTPPSSCKRRRALAKARKARRAAAKRSA